MLPAALHCMGHAVVQWLRLQYISVSRGHISFQETCFQESQSPINSPVLVPKCAVLLRWEGNYLDLGTSQMRKFILSFVTQAT